MPAMDHDHELPEESSDPQWVTSAEARARLGVTQQTLRNYVRRGILNGKRRDGRLLLSAESVARQEVLAAGEIPADELPDDETEDRAPSATEGAVKAAADLVASVAARDTAREALWIGAMERLLKLQAEHIESLAARNLELIKSQQAALDRSTERAAEIAVVTAQEERKNVAMATGLEMIPKVLAGGKARQTLIDLVRRLTPEQIELVQVGVGAEAAEAIRTLRELYPAPSATPATEEPAE